MKFCLKALSAILCIPVFGCGSVASSAIMLGDVGGELNVGVQGDVNTDLNINVDTTIQGDVNCTLVCNLNTGECDTICEFGTPTPLTPIELGESLYAQCSGCHGNPPGTGFAPDLAGNDAGNILDEFANPGHPGGSFPDMTNEDIDNLSAYLLSL